MEEGKDDDSSNKMTLHCQNWGACLHALDKVSIAMVTNYVWSKYQTVSMEALLLHQGFNGNHCSSLGCH